ncbi:MAG: zinc ribbon-containing protein [Enterobacteriaceae bacterium]
MNKLVQHYHDLMTSLTRRLAAGEQDIEALVKEGEHKLVALGQLTREEISQVIFSVQRDLEEFARSYSEDHGEESLFVEAIKESVWQELLDITDKTQLEWQEVFNDLDHHGVYSSGEVVGLGNLICEKCNYSMTFYTPEILPKCPRCHHTQFQRKPFNP